jgi:nitrate/TMAO reductase-like tetraheme cytochrome c subunit
MHSKKHILLLAFLLAVGVYGHSILYKPTEEDAKRMNTTLKQLTDGRALYVNKCASCHNLHLPNTHTKAQWEKSLSKMQKNAKITDQEKDIILQYLFTNSKE